MSRLTKKTSQIRAKCGVKPPSARSEQKNRFALDSEKRRQLETGRVALASATVWYGVYSYTALLLVSIALILRIVVLQYELVLYARVLPYLVWLPGTR